MPKIILTEDRMHKGQIYPVGEHEVSDTIAIALGIDPAAAAAEATPETATVAETPVDTEETPADPGTDPEDWATSLAPETIEPAPKTTRAKK